MFESIHHKTASLPLPNSISRAPLRRGFLLIPFALALTLTWFALSPMAKAQTCFSNCDSNLNTANGGEALANNTTGKNNTAIGFGALTSNNADNNTATGFQALAGNGTGSNNTANGWEALFSNTTGGDNIAIGDSALFNNTTGGDNTATGDSALGHNTTGNQNTATGVLALLKNTIGSGNIAFGISAGSNLTTGNNNIDIGNVGVAGEAAKIRIGTVGTQKATFIAGIHGVTVASGLDVVVGTNGQLGTITSSARFKEAIKPMDKASEAILALRPVIFRYKKELDPEGIPQFGLIAEQVEKVNPDLVARDGEGEAYTVRYEAVNAMLLNEFLKEHRRVEEQRNYFESKLTDQQKEFEAKFAQQQKQIEAVTTRLQKISDQLEASKPAPRLVADNQ